MSSRSLETLHPALQPLAIAFLQKVSDAGISIIITQTYRSVAEQDELYAQGRTKPGKIVTNAKGGSSRHNDTFSGKPASTAFDIVFTRNGKPDWNVGDQADDVAIWEKLGTIGESLGLEWGGRWNRIIDRPHFQLSKEAIADYHRNKAA